MSDIQYTELDGLGVEVFRNEEDDILTVAIHTGDVSRKDNFDGDYAVPRLRVMVNEEINDTTEDGGWSTVPRVTPYPEEPHPDDEHAWKQWAVKKFWNPYKPLPLDRLDSIWKESKARWPVEKRAEKVGMGTKPDPTNFRIKKIIVGDHSTLVLANYPGCAQFGGDKLILFARVIQDFETLDPHFFEDYDLVARFAPTPLGRKLAETTRIALEEELTATDKS